MASLTETTPSRGREAGCVPMPPIGSADLARRLPHTTGRRSDLKPVRSTTDPHAGASGNGSVLRPAKHLLVVETETLVRWSLVTYLARWFVAYSADSRASAFDLLDDHRIDAVVVSDDLSDRAAEDIETHARLQNPGVRVVRIFTDLPRRNEPATSTRCVEKPFELAKLADLLGVGDLPEC